MSEMMESDHWLDPETGRWMARTRCEMCGWECRAIADDAGEALDRTVRQHRHDRGCPVERFTSTEFARARAEIRRRLAEIRDILGSYAAEGLDWLEVAWPWRLVYVAGAFGVGVLMLGAFLGWR